MFVHVMCPYKKMNIVPSIVIIFLALLNVNIAVNLKIPVSVML